MTLAELTTAIRRLLGDSRGSQTWSDEMIADAVNFAIINYCEKKRVTYTEVSSTPTAGLLTLPTDQLKIIQIIGANGVLIESRREVEDDRYTAWRSATGSPTHWFMWDGNKAQMYPKDAVAVTVGYLQAPAALVAGAAHPNDDVDARIPTADQAYLRYAAASWLLTWDGSDEQDLPKSNMFMQIFNSLIGMAPPPQPVQR